MEFAVVPPIKFELPVQLNEVPWLERIPYTTNAPVAPALFAVIPPMLFEFETQASEANPKIA